MTCDNKFLASCNVQELTNEEIDEVSGAGRSSSIASKVSGSAAIGAAAGIGVATFGTTWGAVAVGVAIASAPIAVLGMGMLVAYGTYKLIEG